VNYAPWISRVAAGLVDSLAFVPFFLAGWLIDGPRGASGTLSRGGPWYWGLVAAGLLISGFNRWYLAGRTGQSLGKMAFGLALVGAGTERPVGVGKAFLRDLAHLLDTIICFVGYLFPLWDGRRQTIADKMVGSVVVRVRKPTALGSR
jgi:uncharacterized RDD family membrane protein YckC